MRTGKADTSPIAARTTNAAYDEVAALTGRIGGLNRQLTLGYRLPDVVRCDCRLLVASRLHERPQEAIDLRLIALSKGAKPLEHICIQPQRHLLLC